MVILHVSIMVGSPRKRLEGVKRVFPLLSVVLFVFIATGTSVAGIASFDELPFQPAERPSLPGASTFFTGNPVPGFGVLPHDEFGDASNPMGILEELFFDSDTHTSAAETVSPLSSTKESASDYIKLEQVSPFSKPSMMLLVGCGLVGLAGIGRKIFQGKRIYKK
jgi:hypothetical protein